MIAISRNLFAVIFYGESRIPGICDQFALCGNFPAKEIENDLIALAGPGKASVGSLF